jgi:hypothetical protein
MLLIEGLADLDWLARRRGRQLAQDLHQARTHLEVGEDVEGGLEVGTNLGPHLEEPILGRLAFLVLLRT